MPDSRNPPEGRIDPLASMARGPFVPARFTHDDVSSDDSDVVRFKQGLGRGQRARSPTSARPPSQRAAAARPLSVQSTPAPAPPPHRQRAPRSARGASASAAIRSPPAAASASVPWSRDNGSLRSDQLELRSAKRRSMDARAEAASISKEQRRAERAAARSPEQPTPPPPIAEENCSSRSSRSSSSNSSSNSHGHRRRRQSRGRGRGRYRRGR